MPLNARFVGEVALLGNVGRSMNNPRYNDAGREVDELLDQGLRKFVIEMRAVRETGSPLLGVLMTITRRIRASGGEVVLADVSRNVREFIDEMRMDDYWDLHDSVEDAVAALDRIKVREPESS